MLSVQKHQTIYLRLASIRQAYLLICHKYAKIGACARSHNCARFVTSLPGCSLESIRIPNLAQSDNIALFGFAQLPTAFALYTVSSSGRFAVTVRFTLARQKERYDLHARFTINRRVASEYVPCPFKGPAPCGTLIKKRHSYGNIPARSSEA